MNFNIIATKQFKNNILYISKLQLMSITYYLYLYLV